MDERKTSNEAGPEMAKREEPRSLAIAERGIKTGTDFSRFMSSLMSDLVSGRIAPNVGNAACNAGGKLLKVVEMQMRYGTQGPSGPAKVLELAPDSVEPPTSE